MCLVSLCVCVCVYVYGRCVCVCVCVCMVCLQQHGCEYGEMNSGAQRRRGIGLHHSECFHIQGSSYNSHKIKHITHTSAATLQVPECSSAILRMSSVTEELWIFV